MSSPFVILYENLADSGIFSGGSWLSALPLSNMQDADIERVARSSNATNAATKFNLDLGVETTVGGLALGPCNLSPGATWRVRGYSDSGYSSLSYDSGVQSVSGSVIDWTNTADWLEWEHPGFWLGVADFAAFDELPQYLFHVIDPDDTAAATVQYWLFEFFDAANPDGYVQVGRALWGRAFRPDIGYGEDNQYTITPLTDTEESLGGLRAYFERGSRRSFRATLGFLSETEIFSSVISLMLRAGISRQVFLVPDTADNTYGTRRSFLATLKQVPAIQQLLVARGSTVVDLEEVL